MYSDFEEPEVNDENDIPFVPNERFTNNELPYEVSIDKSTY